jgi:SAM-dependent methyltransferase
MITFQCTGETHSLSPGGWFSALTQKEVFTDTPRETLRRLIAEIEAGTPWLAAVAAEYAASQPWLHRIIASPQRDLFFRSHCVLHGQRILDVGSGWGQQALVLAKSNEVCAVEPNPERLGFVRAVAQQCGILDRLYFFNVDMLALDFAAEFDTVTSVGVLEWVANFHPDGAAPAVQQRFLCRLHAALKPGGQCIIGIENRLGLKYLMGARDDHTGTRHLCTLDYSSADAGWRAQHQRDLRVVTWSRSEYERLFKTAGFSGTSFYAAFPDYKLPEVILPCNEPDEVSAFFRSGQFVPEHDGWDGSVLPEPDQATLASHYRSFAEIGIAHHFAPSFFIIARK